MKLASWTLQNFDGYLKSMKWSSQRRPMTRFAGKVAISIFDRFVASLAAPLVLWVPEGLSACAALWQAVPPDAVGLQRIGCPYRRVWRHRGLEA